MKKYNSNVFTNAVIDSEKMTITEYTKDDQYVFDLKSVLDQWSGVEGISLTIKKEEKITD